MSPSCSLRSRAWTKTDLVSMDGAVGALEVRVLMREDTFGARPTGNDPRVHHPHRLRHERAAHAVALGARDVAVGRERNRDRTARPAAVLDAEVVVLMPAIVRSGKALRDRSTQRDVHEADDARRRPVAAVDEAAGVARVDGAVGPDLAPDVRVGDVVRAELG